MTTTHAMLADDVTSALQLLLLLAHLESAFYASGLAASKLIPASDVTVFTTLRDEETAHVAALQGMIAARGATPIPAPSFDFTAKGEAKDSKGASFAFLSTQYALFTALAQAFEDLGVRAYKGQVVPLMGDKSLLTAALTVHAVEGRHASEVRRLRGTKGWITNADRGQLPAFLQPVYDGEDNTVQLGVELGGTAQELGGSAAAAEAFDEPLAAAQVMAIVTPFLA